MLNRILLYPFGLLVLIAFEGLFTLGGAFDFNNYNTLGWTIQVLLIIVTLASTEKIIQSELK